MSQSSDSPSAARKFQSSPGTDEPKLEPTNIFVRIFTTLYGWLGFTKGYNFVLYTITIGALLGFILARLQYLDITGVFFKEAIPGEVFWYENGHRRVGITMHLVGVLCGGLLAVIQFTPIIRQKAIWLHRICGYLAITLFLIGNAGAFMIMDHSIGGTPAMQVWIGVLGILTTFGLFYALYNIKRLQIDQHRAWMIRTWAWAANIISLRLLLLASSHVVRVYSIEMVTIMRCDEIFYAYANNAGVPAARNPTARVHPACGPNASTNSLEIAVSSLGAGPEAQAALLRPCFLMSAWLAITIHALLAELYLWLTPAEHYRLRVVSYNKQVELGLRYPGDPKEAGLGSSRLGDAPTWWTLPREE